MECTILEILRGDRSFGPHIWLKMRIEPRGPEVFVPLFGEAPTRYRPHQRVELEISVTASLDGGDEMAPKPPALDAPRQSRGASR
jgi:hypothetical protein